jgi:hypothetical protein
MQGPTAEGRHVRARCEKADGAVDWTDVVIEPVGSLRSVRIIRHVLHSWVSSRTRP